ncbi:LOW QUALITY PROTEIN: hypothetical protein M8C21_004807, partial [Ambrosia artemisiifolia]
VTGMVDVVVDPTKMTTLWVSRSGENDTLVVVISRSEGNILELLGLSVTFGGVGGGVDDDVVWLWPVVKGLKVTVVFGDGWCFRPLNKKDG